MANINLTSSPQAQDFGAISYLKTPILMIIALAIVGGAYFWINLKTNELVAKTEQDKQAVVVEQKNIKSNNSKIVFDFQDRLILSKGFLEKKRQDLDSLGELEKIVVKGVYLTKYSYSGNSVSVSCVADNFDNVAKQILNFKSSDYFSPDISTTSTESKDEKINFGVELKIK